MTWHNALIHAVPRQAHTALWRSGRAIEYRVRQAAQSAYVCGHAEPAPGSISSLFIFWRALTRPH